ncbi:MarR family transcriptional regulator [Amycolatopsis taiwanensis]|uniref:MarR family transcriptional regulator n=1 Tax=Amycolatopsis taiwanensis TaxID=342230 RepID=UPI000483CCCA|nr:helix-turn-helix domain-containing protein [Amycolatopsis taiwanensis]
MSTKTRTRKARTTRTTGSARALRPVPDQTTTAPVRTDAEDKLWAALYAHPNSSAAELSVAAKIGKSTAQKILTRWESDRTVTRTPGIAEGGRRAADLWTITDTDSTGADVPANEPAAEETVPTDTALDDPTIASRALATPDADAVPDDATPSESVTAEPAETEPTTTAADDAQYATASASSEAESEKIAPPDSEPAVTEATEPADGGTTAHDAASDSGGVQKAERLAPGALRGMVEDYLRDHPGEEFGPTAIAKALGGKSSGAVSNVLDKLVADSTAVKTNDRPRRFALAPAEQSTTAAPVN